MAVSVGSAVGAGFSLIARRPLTVTGWGVLFLLAVVVLEILSFALFGFPRATASTTPLDAATLFQQARHSVPRALLVAVGEIPLVAMFVGAIMRAVLEPDNRAFASIRFGRQEVSLILLNLLLFAISLLIGALSAAVLIPVVLLGGLIGRSAGVFAGGSFIFLATAAYVVFLMWVAARFSLAAPMTFAEKRVRLLASWEATRGSGWRLLGLAWLLILIMLAVSIAFFIFLAIVALIFIGLGLGLSGLNPQSIAQNPSALLALGPLLILFVLVFLALYGAFFAALYTVFLAPWADVYRQLKGEPGIAATFA